ncbi:PLAT domain-containing protein 2-like [Mercurialis annua]|uniref:PLAT domain-containing protein 2-like n=1 Tax=Mercurialis annua TaxID=3986 RepID=UPI00215E8CDD|nr:PLAT domain-containing protein 2-like [Mercurialis annua]
MAVITNLITFLIFFTLLNVAVSDNCAYFISIKTGTRRYAGTDSVIQFTFSGGSSSDKVLANLEDFGVMEAGHNYYEDGSFDNFVYSGPCLSSPVCYIKLSSDQSGSQPGWYVNYVKITTYHCKITKPHVQNFTVNLWIKSSATRNLCDNQAISIADE